jgi:broad specificity phosphatase PhoE
MTGPVPPTYEPFPAFTEWADLAVNIDTVDRFAAVLRGLRDGTDPDRLARAVTTATRLAAIDTGAIEGLYEELRSEAFTAAHPVLQAAYAHYAFVAIHPFADGNGRVARTLASVYRYRWPGVPLVTLADDKDDYIDALEEADDGRPERLVRFVQDRLVDVIGLVQVATSAEAPEAGASIASLRETFLTRRG